MMKLAQTHSIESFLYFSSSEVYGNLENSKIPTTEVDYGYLDPTNIRSCYAEGKRMGRNNLRFLVASVWNSLKNYKTLSVPMALVLALDDGRGCMALILLPISY